MWVKRLMLGVRVRASMLTIRVLMHTVRGVMLSVRVLKLKWLRA